MPDHLRLCPGVCIWANIYRSNSRPQMMPSSSRQSFSLLLPRTWFPVRSHLNLSPGLAVPGWPRWREGGVSACMGTIHFGLTLITTGALDVPASCGVTRPLASSWLWGLACLSFPPRRYRTSGVACICCFYTCRCTHFKYQAHLQSPLVRNLESKRVPVFTLCCLSEVYLLAFLVDVDHRACPHPKGCS